MRRAAPPVPLLYDTELIAINAVAFFAARNLHGRYFSLLDAQRQLYNRQLSDKLAQETLQSKLEQDRLSMPPAPRFSPV
jgi:hypothetical protein